MPPKLPTRVLVIDDDEMLRDLLVLLLQSEGYSVQSAESGEQALALLQSAPSPNLILTDMQMPGSTPEQLAGRLRRACGRRTPLLAMSGSRPSAATLAHFDGFLLKPFGAAEVADALHEVGCGTKMDTKAAARVEAKASAGGGNIANMPRIASSARAKKRPAVLDTLAASAQAASNSRVDRQASASSNAPGPALRAAPILDATIYTQLAASMPGRQLEEMYAMCINDARSRIASMRSLAVAGDADQFARQAHAIKGSCGMLGATELHRIAANLEARGPGASGSAVNSLDELSSACDRLERMLRARA